MATYNESSIPFVSNRIDETTEYLQKHRIMELFDNLTAQLIYDRPDEPKQFIIDILEKLKKSRSTKLELPCLFDESNIISIFGMLDPTGRGFISLRQYQEALITLGIKDFDMEPDGHTADRITKDSFLREAKIGLARASSTFAEI